VKCSGLTNLGLDTLWQHIERHRSELSASGELDERRRQQLLRWTWQMVESELMQALRSHADVKALVPTLEADVHDGRLTATIAARRILEAFGVERG
jgi:LAO/AO transport system kinase